MIALIGMVLLAGIGPDTRDVIGRSAILQAAEWESSGVYSDYGAPTPTWECKAAASGGDLDCTGLSFARTGTSATTTTSRLYPAGFAASVLKASNTGTDYWAATWSPSGSFTICALGMTNSATGSTPTLVGKLGATNTFELRPLTSAVWAFNVWSGGTRYQALDGTYTQYGLHAICGVYDVNTFKVRMAVDGALSSDVTLPGAIDTSGASLIIAAGTGNWNGNILRIAHYDGWAATRTQIQNITNVWQNKRSRIPHASIEYTRSSSQSVTVNGNVFTAAPNVPGINEKGIQMDSAVRLSSAVTPSTGNRLWCLQWKGSLSAWENTQYLLSLGTAAANNSARLYIDGDKLYFATDGPTGEDKSVYYTHGFAAGSEHTIKACHRGNGLAPYFVIDGVRQAGTVEGTGIGPSTLPTTLYIGASNSSGTSPMAGWIKRVAVCRTEKGCGM